MPPELRAVLESPVELRMRDQVRSNGREEAFRGRLKGLEAGMDEQCGRDGPRLAEPPTEA
jgi:hypothetical protein